MAGGWGKARMTAPFIALRDVTQERRAHLQKNEQQSPAKPVLQRFGGSFQPCEVFVERNDDSIGSG